MTEGREAKPQLVAGRCGGWPQPGRGRRGGCRRSSPRPPASSPPLASDRREAAYAGGGEVEGGGDGGGGAGGCVLGEQSHQGLEEGPTESLDGAGDLRLDEAGVDAVRRHALKSPLLQSN